MGFVKGIINAVADPRLFFMLAVLAAGRAGLEARSGRVECDRLRPARPARRCSSVSACSTRTSG